MAKKKENEVVYMNLVDVNGNKHRIDVNSIYKIYEGEYEVKRFMKKNNVLINKKVYKGTWIIFNYTSITAYYSRPDDEWEQVFIERPVEEVCQEYIKLMNVTEKDTKVQAEEEISKVAMVESFDDIPKCRFHEKEYDCLDRMS